METKENNKRLLLVVGVLLLVVGVSLAYFVTKILTNGTGGVTKATTAIINGATVNVEGLLSFEDLDVLPGHKTVSSIKITATGNNELIPYNLIWKGTNTLTTPLKFIVYKTSEEANVGAICEKKKKVVGATTQLSEECAITNLEKLGSEVGTGTINKNETRVELAKDEFITATSTGDVKYYYVVLEYPNLDEPQNEDIEGSFEGEVTVEGSNIKPDINILAAYVIQEDGSYKEVDDIPQEGYQINTEKSTCSNGTVPSWDNNKKGLFMSNLTKSGTSCYLYFDKVVTASETILGNITVKTGTPDFSQAATTDEGVFKVADGMYGGTSYYWRGAVTNNYVKFAGFCWRIIRINGDGSIRLIYDGAICHTNGTNTIENIAKTSQAYNSSSDRSEYVGWTYTTGSQRPSEVGIESNAKVQLDSWYASHITGTNASKVADGKYCNDRNVQSGSAWSATGTNFNYAAYKRIYTDHNPSLACSESDVYTLKVGLITVDEAMYAGGRNGNNTSYYLYNGQNCWTMSPFYWYSVNISTHVFVVYSDGKLTNSRVDIAWGLRPVINLKTDTTFSDGNGTLDNPYVVAD